MYHETASHYADKLNLIRNEIVEQVTHLIKDFFNGRVCVCYYHEGEPQLERNVFFDVDNDGYGVEYFLDTIYTDEDGKINFIMHDADFNRTPYWDITYFTASDTLSLLYELENIVMYLEETGEEIVKDWTPDWA